MMTLAHWILLLCFTTTLYLIGLIWTIQVVHYPLFALVGKNQFPHYHAEHGNRISLIVIVPMLLELASSVLLVFVRPASVPAWLTWLGLVLVLLIWVITFVIQVPQHNRLANAGFSLTVIQALVAGNWLRTILWTLRGGVLFGMFVFVLQGNVL